MKHRIVGLLGLLSSLALTAQAQSSTVYTGSISSSSGTFFGTEAWSNGASVNYTVYQQTNGSWFYGYDINVEGKDVSHFIIETCGTFDLSDILVFNDLNNELTDPVFGTYAPGSNGNSNPGIPGSMYGFKIDTLSGASAQSLSFSFETYHAPAWYDFYMKDGKDGGNNVFGFNSGFNAVDPDGSIGLDDCTNGHILAPGCTVPEPSVLGLGAFGLAGLIRRRR